MPNHEIRKHLESSAGTVANRDILRYILVRKEEERNALNTHQLDWSNTDTIPSREESDYRGPRCGEKVRLSDNYSHPFEPNFREGLAGGMAGHFKQTLEKTFYGPFSLEGWNDGQKLALRQFCLMVDLRGGTYDENLAYIIDKSPSYLTLDKFEDTMRHIGIANPKGYAYFQVAIQQHEQKKWSDPEEAAQALLVIYKKEEFFKPPRWASAVQSDFYYAWGSPHTSGLPLEDGSSSSRLRSEDDGRRSESGT